ncbi:MAG: sigma-70 family RNA polymerase sigma factor, partial [Oscillospiraceae bacterium]|nr:sigma-70 family RNA polymerase sigma factor [Oscillospiraceae bacterium]
ISRSMRDNAYRALTAREELMNKLQREPTVEEIAAQIELPRETVVFALEAISDPVSLYDPVFQDGGDAICVMDQVRDVGNTDDSWIEQLSMKQVMESLSQREKRILALRFYDGKTQMEVAAEIGISQAQVSRLEKGVMQKIKEVL